MRSKKIKVGSHTTGFGNSTDSAPVYAKHYNELIDDFAAHVPADGVGKLNTLGEYTTDNGVTVDGVVLKDGNVDANAITAQHIQYQIGPVNSNTDPADKTIMANAMFTARLLSATPGGAINYTLPTGTQMDAADAGLLDVDTSFDFSIINIGAGGIITFVAAATFTIVGNAAVAANSSATFRVRKTAANTFVLYRI